MLFNKFGGVKKLLTPTKLTKLTKFTLVMALLRVSQPVLVSCINGLKNTRVRKFFRTQYLLVINFCPHLSLLNTDK